MHFFIVSVMLSSFGSISTPEMDAELAAFERTMMTQRRQLESGRVSFKLTNKRAVALKNGPNNARPMGRTTLESTITGTMTFAGRRALMDVEVRRNVPADNHFRRLVGVHCPAEEQQFTYDQPLPPPPLSTLVIRPKTSLGTVMTPHWLGLDPTPFEGLNRLSAERLFQRPDRELIQVRDARLAGYDCRQFECHYQSGLTVRIWSVPELNDAVLRVETEESPQVALVGVRNAASSWSIQNKLVRPKGVACYFPTSYRYERHRGGLLIEEEEFTSTELVFNEPIDEAVFTLRGMNLPVGIAVEGPPYPSGPLHWWDGQRVRQHDTPATSADAEPPVAPSTENVASRPSKITWWPLVVGLVALGVILALLARRRGRR